MDRHRQVTVLKMSKEGFEGSIRELVDDIISDVEDRVPDHVGASGSDGVSAGVNTSVRRRARIAPRVVKVAARFNNSGGLLDRRSGLIDRWVEDSPVRYGYDSPAGDLALPASTTWSNNLIKEAVARKGGHNNRSVAESVVGRFMEKEDRAAEK